MKNQSKPTLSLEPLSSKLKRIMSQPTTEEIPEMPAAQFDAAMGADIFNKKVPPKTKATTTFG